MLLAPSPRTADTASASRKSVGVAGPSRPSGADGGARSTRVGTRHTRIGHQSAHFGEICPRSASGGSESAVPKPAASVVQFAPRTRNEACHGREPCSWRPNPLLRTGLTVVTLISTLVTVGLSIGTYLLKEKVDETEARLKGRAQDLAQTRERIARYDYVYKLLSTVEKGSNSQRTLAVNTARLPSNPGSKRRFFSGSFSRKTRRWRTPVGKELRPFHAPSTHPILPRRRLRSV